MADLVDRAEVLKLIKCCIGEDATTAALLYQSVKQMPPAQQWIPCKVKLPELKGDGDVAIVDTFLVTVAEKYESESEWRYHVDRAENYGSYIDDFWETEVDWQEGQEVHVIAWMPLPEPYKGGDAT